MSSADAPAPVPEPTLAPDDVSDRTFPTAFRGFDPVEVRAFLGQVADELRAARQREADLRTALEESGGAAGAANSAATVAAAEAAAAAALAEAQEAAASTLAAAKAEADRLVREAKDRVAQLGHAATAESARVLDDARAQAQQLVRTKGEEAEATAVKKIADAEREAAAIRVKAREDADAILDAAKERGREMVAEAQAARERMIADLNKRKRAAAAQLDQLRAGRDRLLESLRVVRRNLDEMTTRLEATEGVAAPVAAAPSAPASAPVPAGPAGPAASADERAEEPKARPLRASHLVIGELPSEQRRVVAPAIKVEQPASARSAPASAGAPPEPRPETRPQGQVVSVTTTPTAAAPPSGVTPRIDAPQARAAAETAPRRDAVADATEASAETVAAEPPRTEERKSSALRILRRNRGGRPEPHATPPQVGRDTPGEGIRIIGREPEPEPELEVAAAPELDVAAAPEPDVAAAAEADDVSAPELADVAEAAPEVVDPGEGPEVTPDPVVDEPPDVLDESEAGEPEAAEPVAVDAAEAVAGAVEDDELPPPLRPEEVRPRIEDLFARIRADREQAVARAREVLAEDEDGASPADAAHDPAEAPRDEEGVADSGAVAADDMRDQQRAEPVDADEHLLQARDAVVDPLVGQLTRRLKRSIQDEQNATLDRLRTARPRPAAADVLASTETQPAPYRYAALPMLEEAARAASAAAPFGAVGVGVDDLAQALADDIATQIRTRVERVLVDAAQDDLDLQTTSERVSSVYREWKTQRVERVATHHLIAAWSRGTFVATPEGTPMRWIVDDDGPCPDCDDNALAGPTPRGHSFPTGQLHPPAHPGCRCLLAPAHG
ncbi:MAG TPA: DivIVA domain-containing protein [Acidimicrobiales bacterium]|nr:DivIVA domain-containing protein [Acidimicrobiales bacterium]